MKKKVFSLMMGLILAFTGLANAQTEVVIGNGTSTGYYGPYYSYFYYSFTEMVWTADEIINAGGSAGQILDIAFRRSSGTAQTNDFTVYMKNVSRSSFASSTDYETVTSGDIVFNGTHASGTSGWETVTLDTPFEWDGSSNLMIGVWEKTTGYATEYFYYNANAGSNRMFQAYSDSYPVDPYNLGSYSGSKTTRTYQFDLMMHITTSGPLACPLTVTPNPVDFGYRPNNCWMRPMVVNVKNDGVACNINGLDFTGNYFTADLSDFDFPFALGRDEDFDVNLYWGEGDGEMNENLVIDYTGNRMAALFDVTAYAYEPVEPDVWEMARVINAAYPFEYRNTATEGVTLYDNYLLPGNAQDGPDAVYKVTFNQDVMLNGTVTTVGGNEMAENAKMAVYAEGFQGVGGPDLNNNYTGPTIGGGQGSESYDVVFGDETTSNTTGYYPCYYLYNYSLSESLYHAADLQTAGMSAGVINSIGYNSTSTYGYTVNGVKIWMANATDAALGTTSHTTAGMTCVYEGSFTQVQGWNEFELNGSFAWDGTSNLLVVFQMNNGDWSSAIQWKYMNTSYVAGFVDFNDGTPYNPTTNTYSASYNHNMLPVTHFVGGGRNRDTQVVFSDDFESGVATGWQIVNEGTNGWHVAGSDDHSHNAEGSYAMFNNGSYAEEGNFDDLYSPVIDLTNATSATLSFDYILPSWSGDINELILYITDPDYSYFYEVGDYSTSVTSWTTETIDLSDYCGQEIVLNFYNYNGYGYCTAIDNVVVTADIQSGPVPPTPEIEYIIENMTMVPGTYYIAASSTERAWDVVLNAEELPCPEMVSNPSPADNADELEPAAVTLSWQLGEYATEYRLVFGSTYYCEDVLVDWTTDLAQTYTVRNLYNNTNYFWRVDVRNGNCETLGEVWGFTTHLNVPQNLRVADETIFEGQSAVLSWTAIQDRTYRYYNVYQDGELIYSTPANVVTTTYTVNGLTYNMDGYSFYVTAVYDEGESAPSNTVEVKVSGNGTVNGHVYEQDGETGIAGATVTFTGHDEFGDSQTFNFTTNATGYYSGTIMAGEYDGMAACDGYQTINAPTCGNPVNFTYAQTTSPVDYILDENFTPVCEVIAQYYPDSLDPASPYVKVYWGCGLPGSAMIEDFETGDFSQFDYNFPGSYPWEIVTTHPYEGQYCMKSGGTNIASASSSVEVTVDIPRDGLFSFYSYISCESSWDNGYYYMDGAQMGTVTGLGATWGKKEFAVTAGTHTFKWTYTKDSSVNSGEDAWFVDYIDFIHDPEPAQPGWHTYAEGELDNALGSNLTTTPSWGYLYPNGGGFGGMRLTKVALFSDNQYGAVGGNYTLNVILGGATPDEGTVASTMTVDVPSNQNAWVEWDLATPVNITGNENVWVIWTANTTVSSWPAGMAPGSDANGSWWNGGNGWEQMLSSYGDVWTMKQYFTNRDGRNICSTNKLTNNVVAATPHFTTVKPVKGEAVEAVNVCNPSAIHAANAAAQNSRAFSHYRVYRTNCYQESPYTEENTVVLACELQDTVYIDVSWPYAEPGVYKWGVGVVYNGNRESEITWSEPVVVPEQGQVKEANRSELTVFDGSATSYYVPVFTLYGDELGAASQFVIPAEELAAMNGSTITSMKFYAQSFGGGSALDATWKGFVKEVNYTQMTQLEDPATGTEIFNGVVSVNDNMEMVIDFSTPYTYNGGNLLIGFENIANNHYYTVYFYGQDGHTNAGMYRYRTSSTPSTISFLPKTTFTYSGGNSNVGGEPIQEPRESVIVWSNCLDKDMYLDNVSVNVLLNSADSPEGVNVTLTNLNEAEQEMYPVAPVVLDETGHYIWDSFRRGEYAVNVTFDGYYPIYDTVSIWSNTDLRYVMTEIISGISGDIYVSRTGWAMWDEVVPGPTPGPQGGGDTEFSDDFENGLGNWTMIDADGDGQNWFHSSQSMTYSCYDYTGWGHNSTDGFAISQSYTDCDYSVYDADNFLVTNQKYSIVAGSTFNFWADYGNDSYPDYFGVYVATVDNPSASDFTQVWAGTAKSDNTGKASVRHDENRYQNWRSHSVDLSAFAGQNVYIAFRHTDMDNYELYIDDVQLTAGAKDGDRHFQYYKVMCTSIDGVPIYNHNTVYPFCQLDTNDPYQAPLVEGDTYLCKVAVMYSTGMSEWSEPVAWVYEPCDHWGPVDFVELVDNNNGNHIHWEFENGYNPYGPNPGPTPGEGDEWAYSFDNNLDGWTTINANGDDHTWYHSNDAGNHSTMAITSHSGAGHMMSESYCNATYAALTPDDYLVAPAQSAITNGSTFSFWACAQDASYAAEHFGVAISTTGNTNAADFTTINEWTLTAKSREGNWYQYTADLSAYAGQNVWIAIRHFNCTDQFILCVDDAQLAIAAKSVNAIESGMVGSTYAFNITDIANFDERVYFLYNLMNDGRFEVVNGEAAGMFVISATDDNMDLEEAVNDFAFNNANQFAMMDKVQAAQVANAYKSSMPFNIVNSMMMDIYAASRENNLCELADPFCTDNGMYEFPAGVNAGSGETGPDYDCLYTTPNPAWYYMRIDEPGDMDIYMYSTPSVDIDFCCWGPFDNPISPCPNGLTADKVVSCSYSANPTEDCIIPASAQTGEYYILVITNYSNQQCNINFSKVSGTGTTDCGILPPVDIIGFLITRDGEYLAFADPTDRDYTDIDEFGEHVYCVRPIYPGEQTLPDHNYGWSMGCPVCTNDDCAAPSHLEGTYEWRNGQYGALISWVTDTRDIVSFNIYRSNDGVDYMKIGTIDASHTEYFDPVEVGTYYYQVTAISDCGESVPALTESGSNFVIVTVTGIEENGGVAMYPNPTNGNVKIVADAMNHITVVNGLGQIVYDADVDCDEMTINMAQFNVGIFTVRIATESGVSVQRLTVVR